MDDAHQAEHSPFDPTRFETVHQVGGIRTGSIDHPNLGGQSCRVAFFDTGAGLRFTVALDRGGDIVEAHYLQHNLAFLTPNGYKPPSPAYHHDEDWLAGWPGGLVTTCGPELIGAPRTEDGVVTGQHGRYSNTPAGVNMLVNPDPRRGRLEMLLGMTIRDSRFYGPTIEVHRQIQCILGQPEIHIFDQVRNRGDRTVPHNYLYHVNFGYPMVDAGAEMIFKGRVTPWQPVDEPLTEERLATAKRALAPQPDHAGGRSLVFLVDDTDRADDDLVRVGMINAGLGLGVELSYPRYHLPRLGCWQHYGPGGAYVVGLEPFAGSLLGLADDPHPRARQTLAPDEERHYHLTIRVNDTASGLASLRAEDGPLRLA